MPRAQRLLARGHCPVDLAGPQVPDSAFWGNVVPVVVPPVLPLPVGARFALPTSAQLAPLRFLTGTRACSPRRPRRA